MFIGASPGFDIPFEALEMFDEIYFLGLDEDGERMLRDGESYTIVEENGEYKVVERNIPENIRKKIHIVVADVSGKIGTATYF